MGRLKWAPYAAAASALAGFGAVLAALSMSPWFVWTENALSDLGHPRRPSWLVFGVGLAAAGALYLVFVWALSAGTPRGALGALSLVALAAGGASLSAIGIVNESYGWPHLLVSIAYFTLVPVGMLLLALALPRPAGRLRLATLALAVAAGALGLSVAGAQEYGWPFPSQAIPEFLASALLAAWSNWAGWVLPAVPRSPTRPPPPTS